MTEEKIDELADMLVDCYAEDVDILSQLNECEAWYRGEKGGSRLTAKKIKWKDRVRVFMKNEKRRPVEQEEKRQEVDEINGQGSHIPEYKAVKETPEEKLKRLDANIRGIKEMIEDCIKRRSFAMLSTWKDFLKLWLQERKELWEKIKGRK